MDWTRKVNPVSTAQAVNSDTWREFDGFVKCRKNRCQRFPCRFKIEPDGKN